MPGEAEDGEDRDEDPWDRSCFPKLPSLTPPGAAPARLGRDKAPGKAGNVPGAPFVLGESKSLGTAAIPSQKKTQKILFMEFSGIFYQGAPYSLQGDAGQVEKEEKLQKKNQFLGVSIPEIPGEAGTFQKEESGMRKMRKNREKPGKNQGKKGMFSPGSEWEELPALQESPESADSIPSEEILRNFPPVSINSALSRGNPVPFPPFFW